MVIFTDAGFENTFAQFRPKILTNEQILWVLYDESWTKIINFGQKVFYNKI